MSDKVRFSFLLRPNEVTALKRIAQAMDRSRGAALRTLIREADHKLFTEQRTIQPARVEEVHHADTR